MRRNREILSRYSKIIELIFKLSQLLPRKLFASFFKTIRSKDGKIYIFLRYICIKRCAKSCGDNVAIFSNVYLFNLDQLEIGNNVSIHPLSYIDASGGIIIGNDVSIAHSTSILSEEHVYSSLEKNIKDQGVIKKKTIIQDNVWIAAGAKILAGSLIETGSIIAAGAVVKNIVDKNSIVGGVPAKKIKTRTNLN